MTTNHTPLTDEQKALPSGALLPSGEHFFADSSQAYGSDGSGINSVFPSPTNSDSYWDNSGVFKTYGVNENLIVSNSSGLFNYNDLSGVFSNAPTTRISGIYSFTLFNPYIHHYHKSTPSNINTTQAVKIPFVSDYTVSVVYNTYS